MLTSDDFPSSHIRTRASLTFFFFFFWRFFFRQVGNHKLSRGLAAIAKDLLRIESIDKARSLKSLVLDHRAFIFRAHGTFCLNSILCITRYLPRRSREPLICCSESTPLRVYKHLFNRLSKPRSRKAVNFSDSHPSVSGELTVVSIRDEIIWSPY